MTLFPHAFETERLRYERLHRDTVDVFDLYEVMGRPSFDRLVQHLSKSEHETPKETFDYLRETEGKWDDGERADWAIYPKEGEDGAGEFAGVASLIPLWDRRTARFGVWLLEPFWGRGYSGERADGLVELAFDRLDLELVAAGHTDANGNSESAITKYVERWGGGYDGVLRNWVVLDGEPRDLHRYTITRAQYEDADVAVPLELHE